MKILKWNSLKKNWINGNKFYSFVIAINVTHYEGLASGTKCACNILCRIRKRHKLFFIIISFGKILTKISIYIYVYNFFTPVLKNDY